MTLPGVPMPRTREEEFYCLILAELRAIRQLLAQDGPPEIIAFEPKPRTRRKRSASVADSSNGGGG